MLKRQAVQNQHYVPKFILRQFVSNEKKEQVSVFNKNTRQGFVTSIKNIMAERRFHEFRINSDYYTSFEEAACRIEDATLPAYKTVLERRHLSSDLEDKTRLAILFAFQLLRTRAQRDLFLDIRQQIRNKWGHIEGIEEELSFSDNDIREMHIDSIQDSIGQFAEIIATKDFMLLSAPKGRKFYLADNPVALHNDEPRGSLWGNIGLAVKGIQIYLPLSSDLMLAAWCPSIMKDMETKMKDSLAHQRRTISSAVLSPQVMSRIDTVKFQGFLTEARRQQTAISERIQHFRDGTPIPLSTSNMDFYNTMQVGFAREFVICQRGDFDLANRFIDSTDSSNIGTRITI